MRITHLLALATVLAWGQEQPLSPAQRDAKKAAGDRAEEVSKPGAVATTAIKVVGSGGNPIAAGAHILTGVISYELQKKIITSTWSMNITQKYAAKGIADFLTKQEKEPFEVVNSKVDGLVILTFTAKGIDQEKAERLARTEPMWKYRKTGWDRIIFTNGQEAWAWDTAVEIPAK